MSPFDVITEEQWLHHAGCVIAVDRSGKLGIVGSGDDYTAAEKSAEQFNSRRAAVGEEDVVVTYLAVPTQQNIADLLAAQEAVVATP